MSAPNAERFVRYTLTAMIDPSAKKTVTDFGAAFERTQKGITETAKIEAKKRANQQEKDLEDRKKREAKATKDQEKLADQKAKEDKLRADKKAKDDQRAADARIKAEERAAKETAKLESQKAREAERTAQAKIRAEERAAAAAERESLRIARINFRANEVAKKQAEDLARAREAAEQRIRREYEMTSRIRQEYATRATDGFLKAGEGLATFGRGLVAIGIAGEEDLEKLVKTLARVQGIVDLTKGGIETYRGLREGVEMYRRAIEAAAKSEAILAAMRGVNSRGMPMPSGAGWGTGGLGAFGIGAGGTGTLGAIGLAAAGTAAAVGGAAGLGVLFNVGGSRDYLASGNSYFGADTSPGGYAGQALGGRLFSGFDAISRLTEIPKYGNVGLWESRSQSLGSLQSQARASENRTNSMRAAQDQRRWMENNERMRLEEAYSYEQQLRESRSGRESLIDQLNGGANPDAVMNRAQSAMAYANQQQAELARMRAGNVEGQAQQFTDGQVGVQEQRTLQAINDAIRLRQESLQIAKQTNMEEKAAADETIRKLNTQIDKQKQLQKAAEDRLLSAKERFGQLSQAEQQRAIDIKKKADANGYAALTREERAVLRGIGTEGTESLARQGDVAAADAAGFDQFFGRKERDKIKDAIGEQVKLGVELKTNQDVTVTLDANTEEVVNTVVAQVNILLDQQQEITDQSIKRAMIESQAERNKGIKNSLPPGS